MRNANIDIVNSNPGLKAETEGLIMAAQKLSQLTRNYQANIIKNESNPIC